MKSLAFFMALFLWSTLQADPFSEGQKVYQEGEKSITLKERKKLFNEALSHFQQVECAHPHHLYNLGNCYYQLSEYGLALWYYERALKEDPRNSKIQANLLLTQQKLKRQSSKKSTYLSKWTPKLKPFEKMLLFYALMFLAFVFSSIWIWTSSPKLKKASQWVSFSYLAFIGYLAFTFFFPKKEALIIQPTLLRRDAAKHYEAISKVPQSAGQKVRLLELSEDKKWVKIKGSKGLEGYVPIEKIRAL